MPNLEQIADAFVRDHLKRNPDLAVISVACAVDSRQVHVAHKADVEKFLDSISRFDASETDTDVELHAQPSESETVDVDLDAKEQLVLAKEITRTRRLYFAGIQPRTKRVLWAHDIRLGQPLTESEIIHLCFQFGDVEPAVVAESFAALRLQLMPAPKASEF